MVEISKCFGISNWNKEIVNKNKVACTAKNRHGMSCVSIKIIAVVAVYQVVCV